MHPCHRQHLSLLARNLSSKHPFPFPPGTHPTPHEIFHLPRGASQDDVKTRYYELVKLYHPDATHNQHDVAPSVQNAQFRAITHAYGLLRRRHNPVSNGGAAAWDYHESYDDAIRAELRRRSRRSRSAATDSPGHGNVDDSQHWFPVLVIVFAGVFAAIGSASSHLDRVERHTQSAAANLAQARTDAQTYGMERRRKIREHVRAFRGETENRTEHPDPPKVSLAELSRGEKRVSDDD